MEIGNVIWIERITREELQTEQRCDPFFITRNELAGALIGRPNWEQISSLSPELNGYWAKLERLILKEGEQSLKLVQYS